MPSLAGRTIARATGRLRRESEAPVDRDERPARQPSWNNTELFWLPEAGEISADPPLKGAMQMIRELKRHPQVLTALLDHVGDLREVLPEREGGPDRRQDREHHRDQPDRLARANERRARRRTRSTRRRGRPRLGGSYCMAYLTMMLMKVTVISDFVEVHDFDEIWVECGFTQKPDYTTVWLYFSVLEQQAEAFRSVAEWLIARANQHDRHIGEFVWVDATKWQTNARVEHCCTDHAACEELSRSNWEQFKIRPPARKPKRMSEEQLQRLHEIESQLEEIEADVIPEEMRFEQMEFDPEEDYGREQPDEDAQMTPVAPVQIDSDYQYFEINGHLYRTRDKTAGLRRITRRSGRVEYWLGGYALAAIDMYTKQIIAIVCFPADDQEYDHYPELMRRVRRALGRYPLAVCADAFYSTEPFFRWNTMRGIASVVPFKAHHTRERADYRTDLYDEHGVPRCQHCGGEGDQDSPGNGLYFDARTGQARIRFKCKTPQPDEPDCLKVQSIACEENWRLLVPLSRKTELYYALRKRALFLEGTFRHWRQLYRCQGKDVMSRLNRRGVGAQELRSQAALMMQWFRLSLRHGWLARPDGTLWPTLNENEPVQLSGDRRVRGRILRGSGQRALNRVLAARRKRGIDLPYGEVAIRKGYARRAPVVVGDGGGGRPAGRRLPRGDDGNLPPPLPSA